MMGFGGFREGQEGQEGQEGSEKVFETSKAFFF